MCCVGKLKRSLPKEVAARRNNRKFATKPFTVSLVGSMNSCVIKIEKQRFKVLGGHSGALCSLLNRKIYNRVKTLPPLTRKKINLQSVNGSPLMVDGSIEISIEIGGVKTKQLFYVVSNMNRNVI